MSPVAAGRADRADRADAATNPSTRTSISKDPIAGFNVRACVCATDRVLLSTPFVVPGRIIIYVSDLLFTTYVIDGTKEKDVQSKQLAQRAAFHQLEQQVLV